MAGTSQVSRFWCFTVNNPTEADGTSIAEAWDAGSIEYLVLGQEQGTEGTHHIQGYMILKKKARLSGTKKLLPRAHLEIARGTPQQASDYCKKDGDFQEHGTLPVPKHIKGGEATKRKYQEAWEHAKYGIRYRRIY